MCVSSMQAAGLASMDTSSGMVVFGGTGFCERCGAHLQPHPVQPPPVRVGQPMSGHHRNSGGQLNTSREELAPLPPVPPMEEDDLDSSSLEGMGLPEPPMQHTPQHQMVGDHIQQHNQQQQQAWQAHTPQMCYENGLLADGSIMTMTLGRSSCDDLIIHPDRRSLATRTSRSRDSSAASLTNTQSVELELSTTATHPSPSISLADRQERWKVYFEQYDPYNVGELSLADLKMLLSNRQFREEMEPHKLELLEGKASEEGRASISYQEFLSVISCKRSRSFKIAVHCDQEGGDTWSDTDLRFGRDRYRSRGSRRRGEWRWLRRSKWYNRMVRRVAKEYLVDDRDRQYYADNYTCCPPPLFVPAVSLIEISFFVYYALEYGNLSTTGPVVADSIFIYRPDKRIQVWRFIFYMLIHAGWVHLFFNLMVQIIVGIPLEMVHGSLRIGAVYMAGVLAGSLGTSVFDMNAFLVGASGGVYALLAAHLANILLNYSEMELGILKLAAVFVIASADVGFAIWDRYTGTQEHKYTGTGPHSPVGYVAHLMGALAGLTIGLLVLKNFEQKLHVQVLWWVALGVYSACTLFAILWNIFYY